MQRPGAQETRSTSSDDLLFVRDPPHICCPNLVARLFTSPVVGLRFLASLWASARDCRSSATTSSRQSVVSRSFFSTVSTLDSSLYLSARSSWALWCSFSQSLQFWSSTPLTNSSFSSSQVILSCAASMSLARPERSLSRSWRASMRSDQCSEDTLESWVISASESLAPLARRSFSSEISVSFAWMACSRPERSAVSFPASWLMRSSAPFFSRAAFWLAVSSSCWRLATSLFLALKASSPTERMLSSSWLSCVMAASASFF
ncbi:hypothetical protein BDY17DRAFT_303412 [Neohortaea acidophila]|uniref:Uncharacterized protein n=1 Tax=Neohortaea acidophila TaxID=245834 RepID=A0A6A6PKK0_9PEZI|nr:uncharacterized protein BDY17DRAFT_303412 [Neohortaea acidophila]KAF2480194.1 hypothetical protein BDY17DRAFT_303412 [Neohortaea acidophila]